MNVANDLSFGSDPNWNRRLSKGGRSDSKWVQFFGKNSYRLAFTRVCRGLLAAER